MKKKKGMLLLLLGVCFAAAISINWAPPPPPPLLPVDIEQNPPIVTNVWVQQLPVKTINGNNMLVQIQYQELEPMPAVLSVYVGQSSITLYDNGTNGDITAGDSIYSAYVTENIPTFQNDINSRITAMNSQSSLLSFQGYMATQLSGPLTASSTAFNSSAFNNFQPVSLSPTLIGPVGTGVISPCTPNIIKQNSLFITDLSVVEDPARTFNVVSGTGNPSGVWTFSTMISNMANFSMTGIHPKDLMHSWFMNYVNPVVVNGQTISERRQIINLFIAPWFLKIGIVPNLSSVTASNWDSLWNIAPESALLKTAPFKLMAIVNRLDLRGNSGYAGSFNNAGETRFIFTLIDPNKGDSAGTRGLGNNGLITGMPPLQVGNEFGGANLIDWKGMNVIFEYGNTEKNLCDLVKFANEWVNLSTMTLGSATYNTALEAITRTVIDANAAPGKINGSAINRVRTNERIFDTASPIDIPTWELSDWEFRQFELQKTGLFAQVTLTNTPVNAANAINNNGSGTDMSIASFVPTIPLNTADQDNLMNWAFSSPAIIANILNGNQSIPAVFGTRPLLSGGARVDFEYPHYLDLNWKSTAPNYTAFVASGHPVPGNAMYKQFRQQLSLGTCQGCHAGETKTVFTQVLPMGYGVSAKYWNGFPTPPDFTSGQIDERFSNKANAALYPPPPNPENVVHVSAFLTGRDFRQPGGAAGYFDDSTSVAEDATDSTMNGLFYVNAPDDYATNKINLPNQKFGYNDLERRKKDLGILACTNCSSITVLSTLSVITRIPLALGSD